MESKRKASSPCQSEVKIAKEYNSPNTSFNSCESFTSDSETSEMKSASIIYKVLTKDGEPFKDSLTHVQGFQVWAEKIRQLQIQDSFLFGIALCRNNGKPFLLDYRLNCLIDTATLPREFKIVIDKSTYELELIPSKAGPASIGDEVSVIVKRTRWNLNPDQVEEWLQKYGDIVKKPEFEEAPGLTKVKTDDIRCILLLRRHIPSLLPAYGRRMVVQYPGQPILCGRCLQLGHARAFCTNEQADWLRDYVPQFYAGNFVSSRMLGRWFELMKAVVIDN